MPELPEYWRHKPSGSLYGRNPHVDFNADDNYEKLSPNEVIEYLQRVNPELAAQFGAASPPPPPEPEPAPVAEPEPEQEEEVDLDDLDDILS